MKHIRSLILAIVLSAGLAPAFAQAPPPVPALPDAERRTSYVIAASTCSCAVGFQLYQDSTDVANWLTVYINGVQIPQSGNWNITSPSGSIATLPRPITNAVLTFTTARTGTVQIVGAQRPRRLSEYAENRGVAARDLNQAINGIEAQLREMWDRQFRTVQAPPGETLNVLPAQASRANMGACFDSSGNLAPCVAASGSFVAGTGIGFTGTNPTTISNTAATYVAGNGINFAGTNPTVIASNTTTATNNTWTGDNYFATGRPWCDVRAKGAAGTGLVDDQPAIQACVTQVLSFGGGAVYFPPGNYCIHSPITVNTGSPTTGDVKFIGTGTRYSVVQVCGFNISAFILNNQFINVEKLAIYGYGMQSTDPVFTGTFPGSAAVVLSPGCSFCILRDVVVNGGIQNIQIQANNYTLDHVSAQYAYGEATLSAPTGRASLVLIINAGGWISKSWFDQVHPVADPPFPVTVSARTNSTACSNAQIVTTQNFKIQYSGAGTTGGSAPTLRPYGQPITDGTCTAFLVGPDTYYSIQIDSGSNENYISQTDMTGTFEYGLGITNTFGVTAPIATHVSQSTPGGVYSSGFYLNAGSGVVINNSEVSGCLKTNCAGLHITSSFSTGVTFTSNRVFNSLTSGVLVNGGNDIIIADNNIKSAATGINYVPSSSGTYRFQLNGNNVSGMTTGITVSSNVAGASVYTIIGNICAGAAFTDSGTGTKYVPTGGGCL